MPRNSGLAKRASVVLSAVLAVAVFPTAALAASVPTVTSESVSAISANTATITAVVNPGGAATTAAVQYVTGSTSALTSWVSVGSGTSPVTVTINLSNLATNASYRYHVIASNFAGDGNGAWLSFTPSTGSGGGTGGGGGGGGATWNTESHPQTTWSTSNTPLSDAAAAALVTPEPELRPANTSANNYVPTSAQLSAFYASTPSYLNDPLRQYVTGRPGIANPTTDELIQWAAHKWGIPEDIVRAEMVVESDWNMSKMGDLTNVGSSYSMYPSFSQVPNSTNVYESLGVMQVMWIAGNTSPGAGTEPLRWESTAFNLDFYAHYVRWLYDGYTKNISWIPNIYAGNGWNSIGGWYGCGGCTAAQNYIKYVQNNLASKPWLQPGF